MRRNLMIALTALTLASALPAAAGAAAKEGKAQIVATVSFRTAPNTSSSVVRYLKPGESVALLEKTNDYWWKVRESGGQTGYVSSKSTYVKLISAPAEEADSGSGAGAKVNAVIVSSVSFREAPSTSGARIRYLQANEKVTVTAKVNSYWYAVTDADGKVGYVSSSSSYIKLTGPIPDAPSGGSSGGNAGAGSGGSGSDTGSGTGSGGGSSSGGGGGSGSNAGSGGSGSSGSSASSGGSGGSGSNAGSGTDTSNPGGTMDAVAKAEAVIEAGLKYLGTPYEYGSDRNTTATFDCSDFVRQAFKDALGVTLPADSASQGAYVRERSSVATDWRQLKRGDLMFFMDYKGTSASLYASKQPFSTKISHVGIYLGDGKILQTYSKTSGGVRIDSIAGKHWEYRFLFGGSAL